MINSISGSSYSTNLNVIPVSNGGVTSSFSDALANSTTQGTIVSISSKALDATVNSAATTAYPSAEATKYDSQVFRSVNRTPSEYAAYYAAGAASISAEQGLPAGKFDFTKLSPAQADIVSSDAMINHGASFNDTVGLIEYSALGTSYSGNSYNISNTPQDALSNVLNMKMSTVGVDGGAFEAPKQTLKWMMSLQGTQISKDMNSSLQKALNAND
jgi:hypothetical protein